MLGELHRVPHCDSPALNDIAIERELPFETLVDILGNKLVLLAGVRVEGCHDASQPKILDPDHDAPQPQISAFPGPLDEPIRPSDHNIRAQSTIILPKGRDAAVRCHEQR
jgi:hypothetical protein